MPSFFEMMKFLFKCLHIWIFWLEINFRDAEEVTNEQSLLNGDFTV